MPSKPHSSRRIVVSSSPDAWHGQPVDVAVGRHHARQPGLADRGLERHQLLVAQLARPDVGRGLVQAALGQPVAHEVLAGRDDAGRDVVALHAAHVRDAQHRREVRVLAVGLLDPAPAGVAGDVEHGGEREPAADRAASAAGSSSRSPRPAPGRTPPPRRSTAGTRSRPRASRPWSVSSWRIAGMPEPRLLDEEALDRVAGLGRPGGVEVRRPGHPADLPDPARRAGRAPAPGPGRSRC